MKAYVQRRNGNTTGGVSLFDAFDDFFKPMFYEENGCMKTDIKETDKDYQLDIEMPGFRKEQIHVSLEDGYLTVSCSRREQSEDKAGADENAEENGNTRYIRKEICESYQRSYYIGDDVEESSIRAKYENGILTLSVPKSLPKQVQRHSIAIE